MDWRNLILIIFLTSCKAKFNQIQLELTTLYVKNLKLDISSLCVFNYEQYNNDFLNTNLNYFTATRNLTEHSFKMWAICDVNAHPPLKDYLPSVTFEVENLTEACDLYYNYETSMIKGTTKRLAFIYRKVFVSLFNNFCDIPKYKMSLYISSAILSILFLIITLMIYVTSPRKAWSLHTLFLVIHAISMLISYLSYLCYMKTKYKYDYATMCNIPCKFYTLYWKAIVWERQERGNINKRCFLSWTRDVVTVKI
jgi:hypothetical protein